MKKTRQIQFNLHEIKTEQFALFEDKYNPKKQGEVELMTELQFKLNQESKLVGVFLGFEFVQQKKVFIKIVVSCHFIISDESWKEYAVENAGKITIPKTFLSHLAMITTGTTRGVLFSKTERTPFAQYIIPTMDLNEMIPEDPIFDMGE